MLYLFSYFILLLLQVEVSCLTNAIYKHLTILVHASLTTTGKKAWGQKENSYELALLGLGLWDFRDLGIDCRSDLWVKLRRKKDKMY